MNIKDLKLIDDVNLKIQYVKGKIISPISVLYYTRSFDKVHEILYTYPDGSLWTRDIETNRGQIILSHHVVNWVEVKL